jgi:hypothetical protein
VPSSLISGFKPAPEPSPTSWIFGEVTPTALLGTSCSYGAERVGVATGAASFAGTVGRVDDDFGVLAAVVLTTMAGDEDVARVSSASAAGPPRTSLAASDVAEASGALVAPTRPSTGCSIAVASDAGSLLVGFAAPAVVAATGAEDAEASTPDFFGPPSKRSNTASKIYLLLSGRSGHQDR